MIKNIIFDFGGVIVHLDPPEAVRRFESLGITDARRQLDIFGQTGIFGDVEKGLITADGLLPRSRKRKADVSLVKIILHSHSRKHNGHGWDT